MPDDMEAWAGYFEVYRECMGRDKPDIKPANKYYRKHRRTLDRGADCSWPQRRLKTEVSAIQHAMNLYALDRAAFFAEYQNQPLDLSTSANHPLRLTLAGLVEKQNRVPQSVVPKECEHVTAYIDAGGDILHWLVGAWSETFSGGPIDYGMFPKQPVRYVSKQNVPRTLAAQYPGMVQDAYLLKALEELTGWLIGRVFTREDGRAMTIEKILIDIKWGDKNKLFRAWCRRHPHHGRILHAAQGYGFGARRMPITDYKPDGAKCGLHWRLGPPKNGDIWLTVDTNWWKSLAAERLLMPLGTPGAWTIYGDDPQHHAMFFDHLCCEKPDEVTSKEMGRTVTEWIAPPGQADNDLWDCLVGSAVGASMVGCQLPGHEARRTARPTLADLASRVK